MARIAISREAQKSLERLPHHLADLIEGKIEQLARDPQSLTNMVKKLKGRSASRLRVGDWRVLFVIKDDTLYVDAVVHRREAYR